MATITYNGESSSFGEGNVGTMPCEGKLMKSDVTIRGASFMILTYNGKETQIPEGKTATLRCGGKIMKSNLSVDVKHCKMNVYAEDDITLLDQFLAEGSVTVTVYSFENNSTAVKLHFRYSDGSTKTKTYQSPGAYALGGVTDDVHYLRAKYEKDVSFTLGNCKIHNIYLRKIRLSYQYYVWLFGAGYTDGIDCRLKNPGTSTWTDWVNDTDCNVIGAQIINDNIYTSDGTKRLYNSSGNLVFSNHIVTLYGEYTFTDV